MRRLDAAASTLLLGLLGLLAAAPARGQTQLVAVSTFGNFQTAGVLATISGDANENATAGLEYRRAGDPTTTPSVRPTSAPSRPATRPRRPPPSTR